MQVPLQITVRDMPHSDALDTHIREKVEKLEQLFPKIISCRVVVELAHKHQQQGNEFNVRIDLSVPGKKEIVVNRDHHEDPYVALRDAFNAAMRQLEDYAQRVKGKTKTHASEQESPAGNVA
ncbi:MAG TPA: ribosome-associated translation inhibitor RaiA [Methylophilaceae bacterium]|nr:ribosome-associated translation inhibitor RaiA [Methylophilaceae bacterium]